MNSPNNAGNRERRCRHCYKDIKALPIGAWADEEGFVYCAKGVPHEPLPVVVTA